MFEANLVPFPISHHRSSVARSPHCQARTSSFACLLAGPVQKRPCALIGSGTTTRTVLCPFSSGMCKTNLVLEGGLVGLHESVKMATVNGMAGHAAHDPGGCKKQDISKVAMRELLSSHQVFESLLCSQRLCKVEWPTSSSTFRI
jgi:hypothetical protein